MHRAGVGDAAEDKHLVVAERLHHEGDFGFIVKSLQPLIQRGGDLGEGLAADIQNADTRQGDLAVGRDNDFLARNIRTTPHQKSKLVARTEPVTDFTGLGELFDALGGGKGFRRRGYFRREDVGGHGVFHLAECFPLGLRGMHALLRTKSDATGQTEQQPDRRERAPDWYVMGAFHDDHPLLMRRCRSSVAFFFPRNKQSHW